MKTVIIALPVPDDMDIWDVQDIINETFPPPNDAWDSCVYENAEALMEDLGYVKDDSPAF